MLINGSKVKTEAQKVLSDIVIKMGEKLGDISRIYNL